MKILVLSLAVNLVMMFAVVGCGIKGDPLPPAETETVQKNPESLSKKEEPAGTADLTKPPGTPDPKKKKKSQ